MKQERSALAAQIFILIFAAVLLVMAGLAPSVARWYVALRPMQPGVYTALLVSWYGCTAPAALALWQLWRLLAAIRAGAPFCSANCARIRRVGWCALICALICAGGGVRYAPLFLVTAAMLFLFFVLQIVAACFRAAADLAEENRLTI